MPGLPYIMGMKSCKIESCQRVATVGKLCESHYRRKLRTGSPYGKADKFAALAFAESALSGFGAECIPWPMSLDKDGYGRVQVGGKRFRAHRFVCEQAHGAPPHEDSEAAHICGNASCVNPSHLRWAGSKENQADKVFHGTTNRGQKHYRAKLTSECVIEIKRRLLSGESLTSIAADYSVTAAAISSIKSGKSWNWL